MKLYDVEYKNDFYGTHYRWISKYNSARGSWGTRENAYHGGEEHQKILIMIHGGPLASLLVKEESDEDCKMQNDK